MERREAAASFEKYIMRSCERLDTHRRGNAKLGIQGEANKLSFSFGTFNAQPSNFSTKKAQPK